MTLEGYFKRKRQQDTVVGDYAKSLDNQTLIEMLCIASAGGFSQSGGLTEIAGNYEGSPVMVTLRWADYQTYLITEVYKRMKDNDHATP